MNVVRTELGLAKTDKRFPKKGTCMASTAAASTPARSSNTRCCDHFPWCLEWGDELKRLFDGYVDRKEAAGVLDYDDLLLYWHALLEDPKAGPIVRGLFDCVLVDEYQDTNTLQAEILYRLSPRGQGLTVVGDDAQSIYSFRAATVRNILDFPKHYPGATVVTLEQNYRSTQPILEATNRRDRPGRRALSPRTSGPSAARGSGRCWSPARTKTSRRTTSSARSWNTARRASTCGGRRCCFGRRITACCWRPS